MDAGITIIEAGKALVGRDLQPVEDAVIVVEGSTISAIGRTGEVEIAPGASRIDAGEYLVLPGFIDAHVHVGFFSPAEILEGGVTTVRDLAWPPDIIFPLARESKSSSFDGPRILAAGPMLTALGGYPMKAGWAPSGTGVEVATPAEGRIAARAAAGTGAAVIKIALNPAVGPVLDKPTLTAIVEAAHEGDLKVTGHIAGGNELNKALDSGVDELAHMLMSFERIPDETLERMVQQNVAVVPTLSCRFGADRDIAVENLARFVKAGGKVVYGTDLGNEGPRPGIDPLEVGAMAAAGMSSRQIISSATVDSAPWLGLENTGVLEPGADADIIAVAGDALDRPLGLTEVDLVWRLGRRVR
ncbi:MAG TPA: amidohydrolase family protein [Actinomycetota bacterium]|nr:amidohydrolase family protein [Actinomycetota bacterium]